VLDTLLVGWALLGSLVMAVAVASDARSRGASPWLWFAVTLLFNVFGVLAYLVIRPPYRLDEDVIESEPAEEPVPLPTSAAAPPAMRWEPERPPERAPRAPQRPAREEREIEPDYEVIEEDEPLGPRRAVNRTWLYVGGAIFLGLVVVAALFALVTAPTGTAANAPRPAATATAVPAPQTATATPPAALLAPTQPPPPSSTPLPSPSPTARPSEEYVVQPGDTLTSIATRYGVSVAELQEANGLTEETIVIGQRLTIPARQ
jgi:hypothetical protein